MPKKYRIAIFSCASLKNSGFKLSNSPKEFFGLAKIIELRTFYWPNWSDSGVEQGLDWVFVRIKKNSDEKLDFIKKIRKNSKHLIKMENSDFCNNKTGFKSKNWIKNIRFDAFVPDCPLSAYEFFGFLHRVLIDKKPDGENPVCYECQLAGHECLLKKGKICFGPITRGGCKAFCLQHGRACWGCRGLLEDAQVKNLTVKLK